MAKRLYPALGVDRVFDPDYKLVTSPVLTPLALASSRLFLAFYTLFYFVFSLSFISIYRTQSLNPYFAYFTRLQYVGLCAYFWAAGVQTISYALGRGYPLRSWPRILQFLHVLLFSTVITFPFVTTISYWSLLASNSFATSFDAYSNITIHVMNSGLALFEILLTHAGPMPFTHLPICVMLLVLYLPVGYITRATQGFYVYDFLNPSKQHALLAAYFIGIGVGECLLFTFSWGLCTLRERISTKRRRQTMNAADEGERSVSA